MGNNDPRRERADQDKALEKAKMNVRIREIQAERGPIQPAQKPAGQQSNQKSG